MTKWIKVSDRLPCRPNDCGVKIWCAIFKVKTWDGKEFDCYFCEDMHVGVMATLLQLGHKTSYWKRKEHPHEFIYEVNEWMPFPKDPND